MLQVDKKYETEGEKVKLATRGLIGGEKRLTLKH